MRLVIFVLSINVIVCRILKSLFFLISFSLFYYFLAHNFLFVLFIIALSSEFVLLFNPFLAPVLGYSFLALLLFKFDFSVNKSLEPSACVPRPGSARFLPPVCTAAYAATSIFGG